MKTNGYKESSSALLISLIIHLILVGGLFIFTSQNIELAFNRPEQPPMMIVELENDNLIPNAAQPATQGSMVAMNDVGASTNQPQIENLTEDEVAEEKKEKVVMHEIEEDSGEHIEESKVQELIEIAQHMLGETSVTIPIIKEEHTPKKIETHSSFKKSPSLAQLATGFMQHMAQQGPMNVKSNKSGAASIEQIAQVNYCQKIIGCLVNSYKCNKPNNKNSNQEQRICIQLSLNKDGSINSLKVVQPSGNYDVDNYLVSLFKDASSSFPPVPELLKQAPFYLPLFNVDSVHSFQTTHGWYIDNTIPQL